MQEIPNVDSLTTIRFPQRTDLIKRLRKVSFLINDLVLLVAIITLIAWIIHLPTLSTFLFTTLGVHPFSAVLYILAGCTLLFGARRHLINTQEDAAEEDSQPWKTWIPISLAATTAVLGFINVTSLNNEILPYLHISAFEGFCFLLLGLALVPPFTRIPHRFHVTQFYIFIASGLSVFNILEHIFQIFSPLPTQYIIVAPIASSAIFALFSFGILLRWSNRGFIGNFTLDATGSIFALRLLIINLITAPLLTTAVLIIMQKSTYNIYQILTILVVCFTFLSSALLWLNIRMLYKYSLEHLLMRESLRAHNINLSAEKEQLEKGMVQLEQEKKEYLDKLNTQKRLQHITDLMG